MSHDRENPTIHYSSAISLRDYFALCILLNYDIQEGEDIKSVGTYIYKVADAFLEARKNVPNS